MPCADAGTLAWVRATAENAGLAPSAPAIPKKVPSERSASHYLKLYLGKSVLRRM